MITERELLRELIKTEPCYNTISGMICHHCERSISGNGILTEHAPSCPWRLACELLEPPKLTLTVTPREFDTILAALRQRQEYLSRLRWDWPFARRNPEMIEEIAGGMDERLTATEIDALCERINVGPKGGER